MRFSTGRVALVVGLALAAWAVAPGPAASQAVTQCAPAIPLFTDWSAPVNLGPPVNTENLESCVTISKNRLSLFFSSNRQSPGTGDRDLYVSKRHRTTDPWGEPEPLTALNTGVWESCPALSLDEHRLYFTSPRTAGGCGGQDIWVSRRHNRRDDFGWEPPVNLGCEAEGGPNSASVDLMPALFEDEAGRVLMYFVSGRVGGNWDLYQSKMRDDDSFGPATPVAELNGPDVEMGPTVRRDGLEVIFLSYRPGGSEDWYDFWTATRTSTRDPWSAPVHVPSLGSPSWANGKISLSFDGRELYFAAWPDDGESWDIWVARREKLHGKKHRPVDPRGMMTPDR